MQGIIYRIIDRNQTKISPYYGSTTKTTQERLKRHIEDFTRYNGNKEKWKRLYTTSFLILEKDDFDIEEVETVTYTDPKELKKRELFYITNNECVNKNRPAQFVKENKKKYYQQYYQDNKIKWQQKYNVKKNVCNK